MKKILKVLTISSALLMSGCFGNTSTASSIVEPSNSSSKISNSLISTSTTSSTDPIVYFTVTFNIDGITTTEQVEEGKLVIRPADPTKDGHDFLGWYTDATCETLYDFNTPVTGELTLYAGFEERLENKTFTITFNLNGGEMSSEEETTVKGGMPVNEPSTPSKDGYTFGGWYTDEDCNNKYDFSTPVVEDLDLYAKWNVIIINPLFDVTSSSDASLTHKADCAVDGNQETYWQAAEKGVQTLEIDLGKILNVTKVSQEFVDLDAWDFVIEGSQDQKEWATLLDNSSKASGTVFEEVVTGYYRYVRLTVNEGEKIATSKEFSVESNGLEKGTNIALGMKGVADCWASGCEAELMFDGREDNYHCANNGHADNHYFGVDANALFFVNYIEVLFVDETDHKVIVDYEDSNGAWNTVEGGDFSAGTEKIKTLRLEMNCEARAILVHHNGNSTGNWPACKEFRVYGYMEYTSSTPSIIEDNKEVYDLGCNTYLSKLALNNKEGENRKIEVSDDRTNWKELDLNNIEGEYINVSEYTRYIRYSDSRNELTTGNLSIWGTKLETNLALLIAPSTTNVNGNPAFGTNFMTMNKACKQASSYFYCAPNGDTTEEMFLDLGNVSIVRNISYRWQDYNGNPVYELVIKVSVDNQNWSTILDTTGGVAGQLFTAETDETSKLVRYISITAHYIGGWTNCNTLEVNGIGSAKR